MTTEEVTEYVVDNIGSLFQSHTKYGQDPRRIISGNLRRPVVFPGRYKVYPDADTVRLPVAAGDGGPGLWEVINKRRSGRHFSREGLSIEELSRLLWVTQGENGGTPDWPFRTVPSAGALYPIETYLAVRAVEGAPPGIYHYRVGEHLLERIREGDQGDRLTAAALGQGLTAAAACCFIWTALISRSAVKYGQRAYRYIYLDAGHIGQNLHLAAAGLGLGCCMIGALYDDEMNDLVGVDGIEETVLYMGAVGWLQGR